MLFTLNYLALKLTAAQFVALFGVPALDGLNLIFSNQQ